MSIEIQSVSKQFGEQTILHKVSIEIGEGEFFVLLGPSGSGKTTILNIIAGLVAADQGQIVLNGKDVTHLPPQERGIGFVFQNYGLFKYMNVAKNIEFGLAVRKVNAAQRQTRCDELLELVGLVGLGERMPRQLSGGQQQRVALARALAPQPEVLLLDEPLGALDAKIRVELRKNLRKIQRQLGVTTILVTHDQEEAFDVADRIGVMNYGRLIEAGTPEDLYQRPQTEFVASFLGSANLLLGQSNEQGVCLGEQYFSLKSDDYPLDANGRAQVLFRPEDVALATTPEGLGCPALGVGEVLETGFVGAVERLQLRVPAIPGVRPISPPVAFGQKNLRVDVTRPPNLTRTLPLKPGDRVWVGIHDLHVLPHPGMSFLAVSNGDAKSEGAIDLGGQIARLAHARLTLLNLGDGKQTGEFSVQEIRKRLGSGLSALDVRDSRLPTPEAIALEVENYPYDLVILPCCDFELARLVLRTGSHHLLLVPGEQPIPKHALVCVKSGEPAKEDILFAGRLLRHLGSKVEVLCVDETIPDGVQRQQIKRFLANSERSLTLFGVDATSTFEQGAVIPTLLQKIRQPDIDLVVLGVTLPNPGEQVSLEGMVRELLEAVDDKAFLLVQSHFVNTPK
ncbi:MAG: ATP-binding cassette domain-containing protein [Anaerolineales bacterium]|nr:ATP-binding cassette domain-containing protein [Anaerolineales bacterium]